MTSTPQLADDLEILKAMLARSFDLVAAQLSDATRAMLEQDERLAQRIRERDNHVDALEIEIDRHAENILAAHRSTPADLRKVITSIKINTDLERIGDYSTNMAKYIQHLRGLSTGLVERSGIEGLAMAVDRVLWETRNAFLDEDPEAAQRLIPLDLEVDRVFQSTFRTVVSLLETHPADAGKLSYLLLAVKSLERLSDHLMNIAESVVFRVSGTDIRHDRSRPKV